ncbi:MAG: zf-HC2 domain-containing protein [bacterium]|nr:zf-HC2 domain-containing protein [bacterium]
MSKSLNCDQVSALLCFYVEDKLTVNLKDMVTRHLAVCKKCKDKYDEMLEIYKIKKFEAQNFYNSEKSDYSAQLFENISAYIDKELSDSENLKVKKAIVSNPKIRKSVDNLYYIEKFLQDSFEKTKADSKFDYTKNFFKDIDFEEEIYSNDDRFFKIVALLFLMITIFSLIAVAILWV